MRSTVARRLSTVASFYRDSEQEGLIKHNPAANVRRPKVDYESRTSASTATNSAPSSSRPVSARLATTPWPRCWASTGYASQRPSALHRRPGV
jgi:hypothetical protein